MFGHYRTWHNFFFLATVITGVTGALSVPSAPNFLNHSVVAQSTATETTAETNNFLQGLLQFNQSFLAGRSPLRQLPNELNAIDKNTKQFNATYFQNYVARLRELQQELGNLETQLSNFTNETQQTTLKVKLEEQGIILNNLLTIAEPFVDGFTPTAIRQMQEFLNFFERENLSEGNYGFYGTVTQAELSKYLDQQLQNFATNLKDLNQTATNGAIAPNLDISIQHLYTTLSLDSTLLNSANEGNLQDTIEQLVAENSLLQQRVKSTHRIILILPLIVMLPTTVLVFILFYYFGKIFQDKLDQPQNYQFSLNDIYGLEDELVARLIEKYELKPRLLKNPHDPFAQKLIKLATAPAAELQQTIQQELAQEVQQETKEQAIDMTGNGDRNEEQEQEQGQAIETSMESKPMKTSVAVLEPVLDGDFEEEEDENFPVHLPNVYDELVDRYNDDAMVLEDEAIALNISHRESYLDDDSEFTPILLLTEAEAGDYWATHFKSLDYLMPRGNLSVTSENYGTFKNIFICYGYQADTVQKAKLLKPARVSPTEAEQTWELVQQGIVVLHRIT